MKTEQITITTIETLNSRGYNGAEIVKQIPELMENLEKILQVFPAASLYLRKTQFVRTNSKPTKSLGRESVSAISTKNQKLQCSHDNEPNQKRPSS